MDLKTAFPLTTYEISQHLHVDLTTVINWCETGKLLAYKTPGGHRRVQPSHFLDFLNKYAIPIPHAFQEETQKLMRVLIVDDEKDIRRVLNRTLNKYFPQLLISEAQDGFEAGKQIVDLKPDLVILDLKLPGVDGFKICANIKGDERLKHTKILAMTGENSIENKQRILRQGADAYLPKPFDLDELTKKVQELIPRQEALSHVARS